MADWIDKVLMAYRPLYLRGLLMDGQYRLPEAPKKPPAKGKQAIHVRPAFAPDRRRVLVATAAAAAVTLCAGTSLVTKDEAPQPAAKHSAKR
jgi:hypothetical protein